MEPCKHCDIGTEKDGKFIAVHEAGCPETLTQKFTSPFDDELCPKCRTMHKSHAIIGKRTVSCGDCGMHFTPLSVRKILNELSGSLKWKSL